MHLGQAPAEDGEILTEDKDEPAVDRALARHDRVSRKVLVFHAEFNAAMLYQLIVLEERPLICDTGSQSRLKRHPTEY